MKKLLSWLSVAVLAISANIVTAADYQPGVHYKVLNTPVRTADASQVEVVEMYGYWCPHCNRLEELIVPWKKTLSDEVLFKPIPVVFRDNQLDLAKAYYVGEMTGVIEQSHQAIFDYLHRQNGQIRNREQLARFFVSLGVSQEDFDKAYDSFSMGGLIANGRKKERAYQITGVPTLIVNGKYVVTANSAGGQAEMIKVVDYLVAQELQDLN